MIKRAYRNVRSHGKLSEIPVKEEIGSGIGTDEDRNAKLTCAHGLASSILSREVCIISQNKIIHLINIAGIKPSLDHKSWFSSAQGIG